jgi:hypothetical protein
MQEMVLVISGEGKVESIYSDDFNLGFLGDQKVFRQTDIVFDAEYQVWDIHYLDPDGNRVFGQEAPAALSDFLQYEEARQFEVKWLNACRSAGIDPGSTLGLVEARLLRS